VVYCRFKPDGSFEPAIWEVRFELPELTTGSPYKLRIATAAANGAAIQVITHSQPNLYLLALLGTIFLKIFFSFFFTYLVEI
jgi:hypothetical protein